MNITVTQISRPIRLAVLIRPNVPKSYLRAVRLCSSLWGGMYFPILPLYKEFSANFRHEYGFCKNPGYFYSNIISNFDPDVIVIDDKLDATLIKKIKGDRPVIPISKIEESISKNEVEYGISIEDIIKAFLKDEFKYQRVDDLRVVLPYIKESDLFSATLCGSLSRPQLNSLKQKDLPKNYFSFPRIKANSIEKAINQNILNFLSLTAQKTSTAGNIFWSSQTAIYLINPERLNDLINYWNLRALGWHVLPVDINNYSNDFYTSQVREHQKEFLIRGSLTDHINVLNSYDANENLITEIVDFYNAIKVNPDKPVNYTMHWWYPRIWHETEYLSYDKSSAVLLRSERKESLVPFTENKITIPIVFPPFGNKYVRHISPRFINEVYYEFKDEQGVFAQVFPLCDSKSVDFAIKGSGYNQWRFSEKGSFYNANYKDEYISFLLPKARVVWEEWFKEKKITIRISAAGKLTEQLLQNIGGVYGTNFLAHPDTLQVLKLFENGQTVLKQKLFGKIKASKYDFPDLSHREVVSRLLNKKIIQFGYEIQCELCNQHSFYTLDDYKDILTCPVCKSRFYAPAHNPDEIKPCYRGIGSFSRNNKADGNIPVLLLLRFFRISMASKAIAPMLSFEILKDNQTDFEIDFAILYKKFKDSIYPPETFFCECKTEIDFKKKDIDNMRSIGSLFPGSILVFATLKSELSEDEKKLLRSFANSNRKGNTPRPIHPILVLTQNELLRINFINALWNLAPEPYTLDHEDEIGHLCDLSCQKHLGLPSYKQMYHQYWEKKQHKNK